MITVFGLEPRSVVVAHMLLKLRGNKAVLYDPGKRFYFDQVEDARRADFDKVYNEYLAAFGRIDFLEDKKLYEVMSGEIFWALRFGSLDRGSLVLQTVDQIASGGSKNYLSESTGEAREMRFRVRRVMAELNRALRYVKFTRYDDPKLSIANASFDNDIEDMVMRAEAMRCPERTVVAVYDGRNVEILLNGTIFAARRQKVPLTPERKDFKHFWSGLPESGGSLIWKDELHSVMEFPRILFLPAVESSQKMPQSQGATLDDFAK